MYNDLTDELEVVATFTKSDDSLEAADEIERLRADRDRYRALAEYLCQNAPSMIVPDEIACLFPDPLLVRGDSTN